MNLSKSYDFFKPEMCDKRIHIIGCGSVGSTIAELLARFGLTKISLYDFDIVEPKNIANQMFTDSDINKPKTEALAAKLIDINPAIKEDLKLYGKYTNQMLNGYVFLCVDNIDTRRQIVTENKNNLMIKAIFDFRTRLTDAQHYAADWTSIKDKESLLNSMDFTHEEALANTPMSACHVELSVAPTIRLICTYGVVNFINFVKDKKLKRLILIDAFNFEVDAV